MLDIKQELNISPDSITIPLLQNIVKFPQLFPADTTSTRDSYCELRWKALKFLKKQKVIIDFDLLETGFHRWDNKLGISLNETDFENGLNEMRKEYEIRTQERVEEESEILNSLWEILHPKILEVSKSRFESGHYADSVEAALKEVNSIVKFLVKKQTGQEFDGADLMNRAFSLQNPIIRLDDLSLETGKNVQKGYMQIFAGSMTGIRNPKAHGNIEIDKRRAIHLLFLASLLLEKIDEKK